MNFEFGITRGRFFDAKKASLRYEGTPFSIGKGRFFNQ